MSVVRFKWTGNHPPTSVVLADPTVPPVYGVRRTDTGENLVESGTPMMAGLDGIYTYSFVDVPDATKYEVWITIIASGVTYRIHQFLKAPATLSPLNETIDSPALVLATMLEQLGFCSNANAIDLVNKDNPPEWPAGIASEQDFPDKFLTFYDSGGTQDGIIIVKGQPVLIEHGDVQIRGRCGRDDYMVGKKKLRLLKEALLVNRNYVVSVSSQDEGDEPELIRVCAVTPISKEAFIGRDTKDRPMFTVNVRTTMQRVAS